MTNLLCPLVFTVQSYFLLIFYLLFVGFYKVGSPLPLKHDIYIWPLHNYRNVVTEQNPKAKHESNLLLEHMPGGVLGSCDIVSLGSLKQ